MPNLFELLPNSATVQVTGKIILKAEKLVPYGIKERKTIVVQDTKGTWHNPATLKVADVEFDKGKSINDFPLLLAYLKRRKYAGASK